MRFTLLVSALAASAAPIAGAGSSSPPVVASTADERPVHAIISSVTENDGRANGNWGSEFPLRSVVTPSKSQVKTIYVLVNGILTSTREDWTYADPRSRWKGRKLGRARRITGRDALDRPLLLRVEYENHKPPDEFSAAQAWRYSFKQNRVLFKIEPAAKIKALAIDTSGYDAFQGFFRAQCFTAGGDGGEEDPKKNRHVRFERYDDPDETLKLGSRLTTFAGESHVFQGDFLVPVGIELETGVTHTTRILSKLPRGTVRAKVSGLFIFSGTCPGESSGSANHDGGGGGKQDPWYRSDHQAGPYGEEYRCDHVIAKRFNPIELTFHSNGREIPWRRVDGSSKNPRHEYLIEFKTPPTGSIAFFIEDGKGTFKTKDNSGAFLLTILTDHKDP